MFIRYIPRTILLSASFSVIVLSSPIVTFGMQSPRLLAQTVIPTGNANSSAKNTSQQRLQSALQGRIKKLQTMLNQIDVNKSLTDSQKTAMKAELQASIDKLTALLQQASSAKTQDELQQIAQQAVASLIADQSTFIARLETTIASAEQFLASAPAGTHDTQKLQMTITQIKDQLVMLKARLATIQAGSTTVKSFQELRQVIGQLQGPLQKTRELLQRLARDMTKPSAGTNGTPRPTHMNQGNQLTPKPTHPQGSSGSPEPSRPF